LQQVGVGSNAGMNEPAWADAVRAALHTVLDPEIGESITELGLVETVHFVEAGVEVVLIPTSAVCPMAETLLDDTHAAVQKALPPGQTVDVTLDFRIAWSPRRMSPALQERFGWHDDVDTTDGPA
jgi:metal-sulfur cluster biosynthetic enzyme